VLNFQDKKKEWALEDLFVTELIRGIHCPENSNNQLLKYNFSSHQKLCLFHWMYGYISQND